MVRREKATSCHGVTVIIDFAIEKDALMHADVFMWQC